MILPWKQKHCTLTEYNSWLFSASPDHWVRRTSWWTAAALCVCACVCPWCVEFQRSSVCFWLLVYCLQLPVSTQYHHGDHQIDSEFKLSFSNQHGNGLTWIWSCWVLSYFKVTGQLLWIMNKVVCWWCFMKKFFCVWWCITNKVCVLLVLYK